MKSTGYLARLERDRQRLQIGHLPGAKVNPDKTAAMGGQPFVEHTPCQDCLSRRERRAMKHRQKRRIYRCCDALDKDRGYGVHTSPGAHSHLPAPGPLDHASGENFWANDPSATRAVRTRMERMPFYLAGMEVPLLDDPDRAFKLAAASAFRNS